MLRPFNKPQARPDDCLKISQAMFVMSDPARSPGMEEQEKEAKKANTSSPQHVSSGPAGSNIQRYIPSTQKLDKINNK